MTVEEFQQAFKKEIEEVLARVARRYSVADHEMAAALHSSARKYLGEVLDQTTGNPGPTPAARKALAEYSASLNCDDLCLAVACAKGDDAAWEDFYREYRSYMI